jgi:oligopeptide transport system substrate-binding protein
MKRSVRFSILVVVLLLVFSSLSVVVAQDDYKILYTGRQMGPSDIPTLDPSQASDVPSVSVITELFPEVGRLHEVDVVVQPGMATWEVSEDGLVYTFSILENVSWVQYNADSGEVEQVLDDDGNVRYVTASDFVLGFQRTLDPIVASDYSFVLAPWVVGGADFTNSDPELSEEERAELIAGLQVVAIDDSTLQLTVPRASAVVESVISMWITAAQPGWLLDEVGDFWIEPENMQSYGPYALKDWVHDESLTMIANPFWEGTDSIPAPNIDEVVFLFLDNDPQLASFEAGDLDVSEVPASAIDRIRSDEYLSSTLHSDFGTCTYYYGFNVTRAPFDDPRAVLAFSLAIDRVAIVENVTRRGETPAGFFTLPNMVAAPQQEDYPDIAVSFQPEEAAALWQEYLDDTGQSASDFSLSLLHNTSDLHGNIAQAAQQMWLETLGVEVQISSQEFGTYLDLRRDADIYRAGWCFDYPDANNWYFDVFHSANDPDNHFNNAEFDAVAEAGAIAATPEERAAIYARAEQLLVRDAASIAPIYFYSTQDLTRPGIERTYSRITRELYEKWDIVE